MNNSMKFEEQTKQIAEALFTTLYSRKQYTLQSRKMVVIEVDSASIFDPVDVAMLLRSIRDQYEAELDGHVQAVIAEESITKIKFFGEIAESLSRNWISQTPGLKPEIACLAVVVELFEKLINKTHGDKGQINILTETINRNPKVRGYIERQGGWGNLGRGLNSP